MQVELQVQVVVDLAVVVELVVLAQQETDLLQKEEIVVVEMVALA
jgi:hypothetical protein